jgi:hypothetical protein
MIDKRSEKMDRALVQLVDTSVPFHTASSAGDHLVAAWRSSQLARVTAMWSPIPLDRRVRLVSVVVITAVLTHIALTGFAAPEPTWWARATWGAVLALTIAAGLLSRAVVSAWTHWAARQRSQKRVNA